MKIFKRNINLGRKVPVIDTPDLRDKCVTTDKLADHSVTTPKLSDSAVTTEKIADKSISSAHIADGAITPDKIAPGTIADLSLIINAAESATTAANTAANNANSSRVEIEKNEGNRVQNEAIRVASENTRIVNENNRQNTWISWFSDTLPTGVRYLWNVFFSTAQTDVARVIADAQDTADHPVYVGEDNYIYTWNKSTQTYNKTSIYVRGEGFHVSKTFESVSDMEAYTGADLKEGDFVLIQSTPDDPDNAKLYTYSGTQGIYKFLVDMSGAIGFTGKTPQFIIGTITTVEPNAPASASLTSDGTDSDGNPKYKLNLALPKGEKGTSDFVIVDDHSGAGDDPNKIYIPSANAEKENATAIANEVTRATSAEQTNATAIAAEEARARAAEADRYTKSETYTKTEVNDLVDTPHQEYVTVDAYSNLPATGSKDTIYRVSNYNGSTSQVDVTSYSEYAWNGSSYTFLCVKSQIGEVFDISVYNNNAKYADLAAALNGGTNIPQSLQKGGMSVKFVQSSDNNYMQFRCIANNFTTDITKWQGVDEKPIAGSNNLIKSGGVEKITSKLQEDVIVNNKIIYPLISTRDLRPMSDGYVHTNGEYSYIVKVKEGDELTIDFTIVSGTYIRFGFTSVYPANGVAVTGYGDSGPQFHSIQRTAPFDGYLLMECASDFTELTVSKDNSGTIGRNVYENNKEISAIQNIVDKQETVTPQTRSSYYIKYSYSTLYEGGNFSVTEPIEVHKGERIVVIEEAINSSIAVISTCDSSLNNISAKVPSNAEHLNELYTYEYLVESDGYVSITFYTSYGTTIKIADKINDKITILEEEIDAISNQFASKNFGVDGDSITAGNQWSKIVFDNLNMNTHHNVGVGGATWACNVVTYDGVDYTPQEYDDPNFAGIGTEAITDPTTAQQAANNCAKVHVQKFIAEVTAGTYPTPDIFCFAFGTNDIKPTQEQVDAAMAATDYPTGDALFNMAGGMRWCLQKIRETYPSCTIFIMLPIQRSWQKYTSWDKAQLLAKVSYIREIAQDFGVQVIDMYHNCGINGCLEKGAPNYGPYLRDGLHPNDDGRKNMGNYATAIIKAFYFQQY